MKNIFRLNERIENNIVKKIIMEMEDSKNCQEFQDEMQEMYDKHFKYLDSHYPYDDWNSNDFKIFLNNLEDSLNDIIVDAKKSGCDSEDLEQEASQIVSGFEEDLSRFM